MNQWNASDFTNDLGIDEQCGAAHFSFQTLGMMVKVLNMQVLVELIHKPWVDVHCIEEAQLSILLKGPVDEIGRSNLDIRPQDPMLNHDLPVTNVFNSNNHLCLRPFAREATTHIGSRHILESQTKEIYQKKKKAKT
jgi:hypothetical protein